MLHSMPSILFDIRGRAKVTFVDVLHEMALLLGRGAYVHVLGVDQNALFFEEVNLSVVQPRDHLVCFGRGRNHAVGV